MHKIDKVSMDGSWLFKDPVDKQIDQQAELSVEIHPTTQLMNIQRGEIVIVDFSYSNQAASKICPALVV